MMSKPRNKRGECQEIVGLASLFFMFCLFSLCIRSWRNHPFPQKYAIVISIYSQSHLVAHQTASPLSNTSERHPNETRYYTLVTAVEELQNSKRGACKSNRGRLSKTSSCAMPHTHWQRSASTAQPVPHQETKQTTPPLTHPNKANKNTHSTSLRRQLPVFCPSGYNPLALLVCSFCCIFLSCINTNVCPTSFRA